MVASRLWNGGRWVGELVSVSHSPRVRVASASNSTMDNHPSASVE